MCVEPVTAIMLVSAVAGAVGTKKAASAQDKAIKAQHSATESAIKTESEAQKEALIERSVQLRARASEDVADAAREALTTQASLVATASEMGGGRSTDAILRANNFASGQQNVVLMKNLDNDLDQLVRSGNAANRQTSTQLTNNTLTTNSQLTSVKRPSLMKTGLSIAGSLAGDGKFMDAAGMA